jgi:creatinine amidohydrolase
MGEKMLLEEMSWTGFEEMKKKTDTVLIPMGSVEMEGPHLPMGVDSIVAVEVAGRVAEGTDVMVAPLIPVTYSDWHMGFPGTLTLTLSTVTQVLREICGCLIEHGFRRIILINSHAGNNAPIMEVGNELIRKSLARVGMVNLWEIANQMAKDIASLKEKRFQHAGEVMTSAILALRPELVDMTAAKKEYLKAQNDTFTQKSSSQVEYKNLPAHVYYLSRELTQSGVMGDPVAATKEKGEIIVRMWVDFVKSFIEDFKKLPFEA